MRWWSSWALGAFLLGGCPGTGDSLELDRPCERIGQRCLLADGPVGVCNVTGGTDCAEPPCLSCMPQH